LVPGDGAADAIEKRPSPYSVTSTNMVILSQTTPGKNWTPRAPPFKVTQARRHGWSGTYDLLLVNKCKKL